MNALQAYVDRHPDRTQTDFAEQFGISRSYLAEILNGTKRPGRNAIAKIELGSGGAVPASSWFGEKQTGSAA